MSKAGNRYPRYYIKEAACWTRANFTLRKGVGNPYHPIAFKITHLELGKYHLPNSNASHLYSCPRIFPNRNNFAFHFLTVSVFFSMPHVYHDLPYDLYNGYIEIRMNFYETSNPAKH